MDRKGQRENADVRSRNQPEYPLPTSDCAAVARHADRDLLDSQNTQRATLACTELLAQRRPIRRSEVSDKNFWPLLIVVLGEVDHQPTGTKGE